MVYVSKYNEHTFYVTDYSECGQPSDSGSIWKPEGADARVIQGEDVGRAIPWQVVIARDKFELQQVS